MRWFRSIPLVLGVLTLLLVLALPSHAQTLRDRVLDEAGVMSEEQMGEALDAIEALDSEHNVQLWALFVPTTDGQPITDYADAVAAENGLGGNDALLAVAVDDRRDAIWVGSLLDDVSDEELDRILADEVEPRLADGEWGAAVAGAADGLGAALDGDAQPTAAPAPAPGPAPSPAPADDGPSAFMVLVALALVGAGGWLLWTRWQAGRAAEEDDRERERRLRGLAQRANSRLIETDELLRHNAQELGFVEAEFGPEAAEPFAKALAAARAELQAAFRSRQQLDDDVPDTPDERQRLLDDVISRTDRAHELVEEQTERFQELRDLERRAPQVLAAQQERIANVRADVTSADEQLARLGAEASGSSQAVSGNVEEARKRIDLADRSMRDGTAALDAGDRGAAARAAKASQDMLAQAASLLAAIDHESSVLDEARAQLDGAVARARADLDAARDAVTGAAQPGHRDELATAVAKLEAASAASSGSPRDLVLAYRLAREAESEAEAVMAGVREGEERRAKERAAVVAAIRAAELSVDRAEEFIAGRHHGVGRRPRTALSEAEAALERARSLQEGDARAAVEEARRARELADQAYERARRDFSTLERRGGGGTVVIGGQPFGTGRNTGWGSDVGGAIIGGIIGSILSGGGGRGRRGGGGFGGFGGGFGGGGRSGGFGGGGRSFGGGFGGGGGGRSRGGGW